MIKETTYCKRSVSVFAKQGKKTKGKMKEDMQTTEETALTRQEGKKKAKGSPVKRRLIPAANYKQSVRDTFIVPGFNLACIDALPVTANHEPVC